MGKHDGRTKDKSKYMRDYYMKNKDELVEYQANYYLTNKEELQKKRKEWYLKNKQRLKRERSLMKSGEGLSDVEA